MRDPRDPGSRPAALILSGGSESVSVSLADELLSQGIPLIVVSLGLDSLIRDVPGVIAYHRLDWPPVDSTSEQLLEFLLKRWSSPSRPLPVFATEDGGLRFLFENRDILADSLLITGATRLESRGLDKADLFEFLGDMPLSDCLAPTAVLLSPQDLYRAKEQLGTDLILKPALKPLDMTLPSSFTKVVSREKDETDDELVRRLAGVWRLADRWVAQPRLRTPVDGEALFWGLRDRSGKTIGLTAYERWKQPRVGGTAAWVEVNTIPDLPGKAERILSALDFRGLVEMPFLQDSDGDWRLIEINPRPWVQVGLPHAAGVDLVYAAYQDAVGDAPGSLATPVSGTQWTSPERMILSVLNGDYGPWWKTSWRALKVIASSQLKAVHGTRLPRVRRRWIRRSLTRLLSLRRR